MMYIFFLTIVGIILYWLGGYLTDVYVPIQQELINMEEDE
jgi:hypothetical protein